MTSKVRVLLPPPAFARDATKAAAPKPDGRRRAGVGRVTARQANLLRMTRFTGFAPFLIAKQRLTIKRLSSRNCPLGSCAQPPQLPAVRTPPEEAARSSSVAASVVGK